MNWTDLPPLNALKAFAAVAEAGSYTAAGVALNVSHAAVLQQVKLLEERLGVALIIRDGRSVKPTAEGALLAHELTSAFTAIHRGVEALTDADAQRPVQISMSPAFAVSWLMPRLVDFQEQHPDITLLLNPTSEVVALRPGGIDVAIRYQDRRTVVEGVDPVLNADMVVVATPGLIGDRRITDPADLVDFPWLQELGTQEVADWMARHRVSTPYSLMISHMPGNLIMDAVRRGDGITYTARPFVEDEIKAGRLIELFCEPGFGVYHIRTGPGVLRQSVRAFIRWLRQQAAQ